MTIPVRDRLIVALDLPTVREAEDMVKRLGDAVTFYKIGLELVYGGGIDLAERLIATGQKVFLDLKLHDIPNTVERATAQVARLGVSFLTVHAYPQTMRAALDGRGDEDMRLLGVTVLTSSDDADLKEAGYGLKAAELVEKRAGQARALGMDGLVMSAHEAAAIRKIIGPDMVIVTPGIRPAGEASGDQKRIMTPTDAIRAGADHLVVGRPITGAPDPRAAALAIQAEIKAAAGIA